MLIKLVASVVNGILTISKLVYSHATEGVIKQVITLTTHYYTF